MTGLASVVLAGAAVGIGAQEQAGDAPRGDAVVISSPRLPALSLDFPAATSVLSGDDVGGGRQQLGLDEPLARVPGVFAQNRYNFAQDTRIAIRGFGARSSFGIRGIRIFVDDIPATLPDGQSTVDAIDLGAVERIEVIRGPSSGLYGSASGGVISLYSRDVAPGDRARARLALGDHGYRDYRVSAGGEHGSVNYSGSAVRTELDGFRRHASAERNLLSARVRHDLEAGDVLVVAGLLDSPLARDPGALTAIEATADPRAAAPNNLRFDTGESVSQQKLGVVVRRVLGASHEWRWKGYGLARQFDNRLPFTGVELDRRFAGTSLEYRHVGLLAGRGYRLLLGLDVERQDDDRRRRANDDGQLGVTTFEQRERVSAVGLFAHHELGISDRWQLSAGMRFDQVRFDIDDRFLADGDDSGDVAFGQWSPTLALRWRAEPRLRLYGRFSTGFETPTTTELASPTGGGGFNRGLDAERAANFELGAKGDLGAAAARFQLALFHIEVNDQLVGFEIPTSPGRFAFENAGRSVHRGLEVGLVAGPLDGWRAQAAYTWSDFRFERFRDRTGARFDRNRVPGIPQHLLNIGLDYTGPGGIGAGADVRVVGAYFADNANRTTVAGHAVVDLRATYRRRVHAADVEIFAGLNNVFDRAYNANVRLNAGGGRFFEPAPDRNVYMGVELSF